MLELTARPAPATLPTTQSIDRRVVGYRPDIDGLRTVAVMSVVAFHLGTSVLTGGFVGVDVFFVISGYLITGTLLATGGGFAHQLGEFYKRRIKRIFPALFALYAAVLIASFAIFFSDETVGVAQSTVASAFFLSNILFHASSSYFDHGLDNNPLLHTWSLSVEEQFYLLFPLLLFLGRRYAAERPKLLVGLFGIGSFLLCWWRMGSDMSAAFYLVQYRAWELAIGSLVALGAFPELRSKLLANVETALGLAMIVTAAFLYNRTTPFPGPAALLPCMGAALVIHGGTTVQTLTGGVLSTAPMRAIGLISYSLYLWHWPVIVFFKSFNHPLTVADRGWLLLASLILATLSYALVEQPFRQPGRLTDARRVMLGGVAMMAVTGLAAVGLAQLSGRLWPISPTARSVLAYLESGGAQQGMRTGSCFLTSQAEFGSFDRACLAMSADRPNILLIGDSHGAHLYPGLVARLPDARILQATAAGCKPVLSQTGQGGCSALMRYIFDEFVVRARPQAVILSARWTDQDLDGALTTARFIKRFVPHVVVSGPIAEYDVALPRLIARNIDYQEPIANHLVPEVSSVDQRFREAFAGSGIGYVSPLRALCEPTCTIWAKQNVPIQFDYGHLTGDGSRVLVGRLEPQLRAGLGLAARP